MSGDMLPFPLVFRDCCRSTRTEGAQKVPRVSTTRTRQHLPGSALGEAGAVRNGPANQLACVVRPPRGTPQRPAPRGVPSEPAARLTGLRLAVHPSAAPARSRWARAVAGRYCVPGRCAASATCRAVGPAAAFGRQWRAHQTAGGIYGMVVGDIALRWSHRSADETPRGQEKGAPPHATVPLSAGKKPGGTPWGVAWGRGS